MMSGDETWPKPVDIRREDQRKLSAPVQWVAVAKSAAPLQNGMDGSLILLLTSSWVNTCGHSWCPTYVPLTSVSKHRRPVCQVAPSEGFTRDGLRSRISILQAILPGCALRRIPGNCLPCKISILKGVLPLGGGSTLGPKYVTPWFYEFVGPGLWWA
jgi:hypothetical protein